MASRKKIGGKSIRRARRTANAATNQAIPLLAVLALLAVVSIILAAAPTRAETPEADDAEAVAQQVSRRTFESLSEISAKCVSCHVEDNRGLYQQWGRSKHYGANVGCFECHQAQPGDADAFRHKGHLISVIVSPDDCGRCHEAERDEFANSSHAHAGAIEGSDAFALGAIVQGDPTEAGQDAALSGCRACHGAPVRVHPNGRLDQASWPNTGIGRINPDGSTGACTACHQRHEFSQSQARRPEACGRCHRGSAHPQMEIYAESKHGISFFANVDRMNLESPKWVPGEDYDAAPTCATCHMSATLDTPLSHDVSNRISWNLREPISEHIDAHPQENAGEAEEPRSWEDRRDEMMTVCVSCHTETLVENFYAQFDGVVRLYNNKFARPGTRIMEMLAETGLRTATPFDEAIEWTWFKIWHQAGRRLRHGASMMAPDFVQWQGFYELSELFYTQFLPQAEAIAAQAETDGQTEAARQVNGLIEAVRNYPAHQWSQPGSDAPE